MNVKEKIDEFGQKLILVPKWKLIISVVVLIFVTIVGTKTFSAIREKSGARQQQYRSQAEPSVSTPKTVEPDTNKTTQPATSGDDSSTSSTASMPSCGTNYSFFDHDPTEMNHFSNITPLGNLNPSGHVFPTDHIYFYHSGSSTSQVFAPGKVRVTRISVSQNKTAGTTDYSIYFKPCSELEFYYLHLSTVSEKIKSAILAPFSGDSTYSTGGSTYRNYGKDVDISVESGEAVGTFTGRYAFDMGAHDSRTTLNFINPNARPNSIHTVCPLDYYSGGLKATLYNYLGGSTSRKRTVAPICGTVDQDVAGTAQGVWLLSGTTKVNGEDQHLALVHDNVDPTKAVFSIGTSIGASGLSSGVYSFAPSSGSYNNDFNSITADGNIHCFRATSNTTVTIILQLTSPTAMKIEKVTGDCSTRRTFSGNATEFQR